MSYLTPHQSFSRIIIDHHCGYNIIKHQAPSIEYLSQRHNNMSCRVIGCQRISSLLIVIVKYGDSSTKKLYSVSLSQIHFQQYWYSLLSSIILHHGVSSNNFGLAFWHALSIDWRWCILFIRKWFIDYFVTVHTLTNHRFIGYRSICISLVEVSSWAIG